MEENGTGSCSNTRGSQLSVASVGCLDILKNDCETMFVNPSKPAELPYGSWVRASNRLGFKNPWRNGSGVRYRDAFKWGLRGQVMAPKVRILNKERHSCWRITTLLP